TGGTTNAIGNIGAAGIGGGLGGYGAAITVNDGTVLAVGGTGAAGIGGGFGGTFTMPGNVITLDSLTTAATDPAGKGENISINAGTVTATGGDNAAGIGGGGGGMANQISIVAATTTGIGGTNGSGVGAGYKGTTSAVTLKATTALPLYLYEGQNGIGSLENGSIRDAEYNISDTVEPFYHSRIAYGDFVISGGTYGTDYHYDYSKSEMVVTGNGQYTIRLRDGVTSTTQQIKITGAATLTLQDIVIDRTSQTGGYALLTNSTGNIKILLSGKNRLIAGANNAALQKEGNGKLFIDDAAGAGKAVNSLEAIGSEYGAAIGGAYNTATSNIEQLGGIIIATGKNGAAIGGGSSNLSGTAGGEAHNIQISGGKLTATIDKGVYAWAVGPGASKNNVGSHSNLYINASAT
ncbi:MAG: hypothetical protein RSA20_09395, partial [Oscillospiraceae bacterium]